MTHRDPIQDSTLMAMADRRAAMQVLLDTVPPGFDDLRAVYAFSIDRLQYEISAYIAGSGGLL